MSNRPDVTHLLWLDLETTGVDEHKDEIIEIGMILTDRDLNEIDQVEKVIRPTAAGLQRLLANQYVRDMHAANGLLDECQGRDAYPDIRMVDEAIYQWLEGFGLRPGTVAISGSGVGHFDMRFLAVHMPILSAHVTHWPIDVGSLRRAFRFATGDDLAPGINDAKPHRSLDDVRLHLTEAREFWHLFQSAA